ncbi:hypothetical protein Tco_0105878, partial [Tanacetum coccineum]
SPASPVSNHISGIMISLVEDSVETPRQDMFYASMSVDPSVANVAAAHHITLFSDIHLRMEHSERVKEKWERRVARQDAVLVEKDVKIERLRKRFNEKPSREMARLRLGFKGAEREVRCLRKQVEELKVEVGKVPGMLASYSQKVKADRDTKVKA